MTDREPADDHSRSVWVRSDRSADGAYVVTVELDPDHSRVIDRADLRDYVLTVNLVNSVGLDEATALCVVHGLRAHRTGA
jgi:hypothetical protein